MTMGEYRNYMERRVKQHNRKIIYHEIVNNLWKFFLVLYDILLKQELNQINNQEEKAHKKVMNIFLEILEKLIDIPIID